MYKDINYWTKQSLQSTYWAGFIAGRGSISTKNHISICLHKDKEERLIRFLEDTESKARVLDNFNRPGKDRGIIHQKRIIITNEKWATDLKDLYNLPSHRTKIYTPNLTDEKSIQIFLLGYLDCGTPISYQSNGLGGNIFKIGINGHYKLLNWFKDNISIWTSYSESKVRILNTDTHNSHYDIVGHKALALYSILSNLPVDKSNIWGREHKVYYKYNE